MNRNLAITLTVLACLIIFAVMGFGGIYNSLVRAEEKVNEAWAQVENVYQRRTDLIPNLVETVKGYAAHEKETLQGVVEARSKISQMKVSPENPESLAQFEEAQQRLASVLSRLLVVVERYPELKANQNFLALQSQLEGSENRIAVERRRFNETASDFNAKIRIFPNSLVARLGGFERKAYFAADESARIVPSVQF